MQWLNGPTQMEDHRIGKKHKKHTIRPTAADPLTQHKAAIAECARALMNRTLTSQLCPVLSVHTAFTPEHIEEWGLMNFRLPWLFVLAPTVVYACRLWFESGSAFVFARDSTTTRTGYVPKICLAAPSSASASSSSSDQVASSQNAAALCALCGEGISLRYDVAAALSCGHLACDSCQAGWIRAQVEEHKLPVRCWGCVSICKCQNDIICLPDFYVRSVAEPCLYAQYLKISLELWVANTQDARVCLTPDCDGMTFIEKHDLRWTCSVCRCDWCVPCGKSHDPNVTCEEHRLWALANDCAEQAMQDLISQKLVKVCPKCSHGVTKSEGCNHITCKCGIHFCYLCNDILPTSDPYVHYRQTNRRRVPCVLFDGQ